MRSSLLGIVAFSLLTTFGSTALADDAPAKPPVTKTKKKPKKPAPAPAAKEPEVDVASSTMPEPIVTLDSVSAPPAAAPPPPSSASESLYANHDKIGESAPAISKRKEGVDPTGLTISGSLIALAPLTGLVDGTSAPTAGVGIELRLGYYVSDHVGISGGLRISDGHMICHDDEDLCNGIGVQLPLMLQFAQSRNDGLYGEVGVGLLTAYLYGKDPSFMRIWTPAVLKTGVGYRVGNLAKGDFERKLSIDILFSADLGRMTNVSIEGFSDVPDTSGSIANPSTYVSAGLSVGAHFSL